MVTKRTLPENQTRLHQQNARAPSRPSPTSITISSSSFFSASFTSSPRCSNFIFTSAQDPVSERAGSGRADGGGQLGWVSLCPCWLWSLGPSISVRGKHLRNPLSFHPPPLTPKALSQRHVSAKWSLYTVLTGPTSLSTGQSGKQPIIFFPSASQAGAWTQQVNRRMITKAGGGCDENKMGLCLVV